MGITFVGMDADMTFSDYLKQKKIDESKFSQSESDLYAEMKTDFAEMHPDSFTAHYLFRINPMRRKYILAEDIETEKPKPKAMAKPKFVVKKK